MSDKDNRMSSTRGFLGHLMLFLLSMAFVVFIFPREGIFRYDFQKGKPWMEESLFAPWDFAIRKSGTTLSRERDSLLSTFTPYFDIDTNLAAFELNAFVKYIDEQYKDYSGGTIFNAPFRNVKNQLHDVIDGIYSNGIMEVSEITESVLRDYHEISILKGNVSVKTELDNVYSNKEAYRTATAGKNSIAMRLKAAGNPDLAEFLESISLYDFISPNLFYNEEKSISAMDQLLSGISLSKGLVQEGELIITRGEIVSAGQNQVLESLKTEYEKKLGQSRGWYILIGRIITVSACYLILFLFLYHFRREVLETFHKTVFILILILIFVVMMRLVLYAPRVSIYIIPFAIIPIIVRTFYDARLALFIHLVTIMICGFMAPNSFEFVFMSFIAGVIAIFSLTNDYRRGKLLFSSIMVILSYSLVYSGITILKEGALTGADLYYYGWFGGNGVLLLITYPLIFLFEKTFGFLSDATLFELSDTNHPLLRRLAGEAPGTFQHSLQVSNLAEEGARAIGANSLLVRTGALYHDIGKLKHSEYFTENQSPEFNPHENLKPEDSAKLIIAHITHGVELAKKHKLPQQIIEFIITHQGDARTYYFYRKYKDTHPGEEVDAARFSYPGPRPGTKETAVLMMADAVEATSRSLKDYSEPVIREMVETIIDTQIEDGQFVDAPISFRDIKNIKEVFVKRLLTIYHARISYPKREKMD